MSVKFYTKAGLLTRYGFSCGYVEKCEPKPGVNLEMWMEHNTFHVRAHNHNSPGGRIFWDVFDGDELTKARKRYSHAKRELKASV